MTPTDFNLFRQIQAERDRVSSLGEILHVWILENVAKTRRGRGIKAADLRALRAAVALFELDIYDGEIRRVFNTVQAWQTMPQPIAGGMAMRAICAGLLRWAALLAQWSQNEQTPESDRLTFNARACAMRELATRFNCSGCQMLTQAGIL